MRRFLALAAAVLAAVGASGGTAAAQFLVPTIFPNDSVTISIVDEPGLPADALLIGLGVYPGSRDADEFLTQVGAGAPTGDGSGARGEPLGLSRALGGAVGIEVVGPRAALLAYGGPFAFRSRDAVRDRATLRVVDGEDPDADLVIIVPSDGRTPLRIALRGQGYRGLLDAGQTRQAGIVTPYDLSATLVVHFSQPVPSHFPGRPLIGDLDEDPLGALEAIERQLRRDASFMQSLTAWTVGIGLGFGFLVAWFAGAIRRPEWSGRLAAAASTVTIGFLIGTMIPVARGDVRAIPLALIFLVATLTVRRDPDRIAMSFFVLAAGASAMLAVIAAADPGGFAANALWGNPLVSWRFFGLQNFGAAFIAGGVIVGATALGLRALPLAILTAAMLVIVGSPRIGANFVGVLTLAFGAAFATLALRRGRMRAWMVGAAGGVALAAFAIALLADAGGATSHGGAAAQQIGRGGLEALWDLTTARLRLNVRAINAFPGGWLWVAVFLGLYARMIADGWRCAAWPVSHRIAIVAGALAGLAALGLEDSGFKTTAVLGFPALMLWTIRSHRPVRA